MVIVMPKKTARKWPKRSQRAQNIRDRIQSELAQAVKGIEDRNLATEALSAAARNTKKIPGAGPKIRVFELHKFLSKRKNWIYIQKYKVFENVLPFVPNHQRPALIIRMVKTMAKATGFLESKEVFDAVIDSVRSIYPNEKFPGRAKKYFSEAADLIPRMWKNLPLFDTRRGLRVRLLFESERYQESINELQKEYQEAIRVGDTFSENALKLVIEFYSTYLKK